MYHSDSKLAEKVCDTIGIMFCTRAIECMQRGKIYVRGTLLKPDETRFIEQGCREHGYKYMGPFAN